MGAVEWSTGALFAVSAARFGWSWTLWPTIVFAAGAVSACAVDLACARIPTRFAAVTGALCVALISAAALGGRTPEALVSAAAGFMAGSSPMLALHLASPTGLGMGDVRLAGLVGLLCGWVAWRPGDAIAGPIGAALAALFVATLVTLAVHGLTAVRGRSDTTLPFAPALTVGAFVVVLGGPS